MINTFLAITGIVLLQSSDNTTQTTIAAVLLGVGLNGAVNALKE